MTRGIIWADSGPGVGLGHVARASAVAEELQTRGVAVTLLSPDQRGADYAREQGLQAVAMAPGFDAALRALGGGGGSLALLDSYRLGPEDFAAARRAASLLVVFNDDGRGVPPCDVVVNGAPGAEMLGYEEERGTDYLLGASYFPLRAAFRDAPPKTVPAEVGRVVVTTGGEDVHGQLETIVAIVREIYPDAAIAAITGSAASAVRLPDARCEILVRPSQYPALVRDADLIVCGAGQTLIEAAAVGTPAAAVLLSDDQRHQHAAVIAAGACVDGGSWMLPANQFARQLRSALEGLRDAGTRAAVRTRGRALVDGRGAARIAEAVTGARSRL